MRPLLSYTLLLAFVCAMMKITFEHAQKRHTNVEGRERGVLTKIICFCEHYNGLILYFIADYYLLLDSFYAGSL